MNPALLAVPQDVSTPFSGLHAIESGTAIIQAIQNGDWLSGALGSVGLAMDAQAVAADPLAAVVGMGVGWILEHIQPLKSWLNDLTGDSAEVAAFAQTWSNIGAHLHGVGDEMLGRLREFDGFSGQLVTAYTAMQTDAAQHVHAAGDWANGVSEGMRSGSAIVQYVHDLVRDAISQLVTLAITAASAGVFTLGLGAPAAVAKVATQAASMAASLSTSVVSLVDSVSTLSHHLDDLSGLMDGSGAAFASSVNGAPTLPSPGYLASTAPVAAGASLGAIGDTSRDAVSADGSMSLGHTGTSMQSGMSGTGALSSGSLGTAAGGGIAAGATGVSAAGAAARAGAAAGAAPVGRADAAGMRGQTAMGGMPPQGGAKSGSDEKGRNKSGRGAAGRQSRRTTSNKRKNNNGR